MLKSLLVILVLIASVSYSFAATVDVGVEISEDETLFRYVFNFDENEDYASFSFEKTRDAKVVYSRDSEGQVLRYTVAGDYFIFRPDEIEGKSFEIRYTSKQISQELLEGESFSAYQNFNFPVESLVYRVSISENFGEPIEIFPRSYELTEDGGIVWYVENPKTDTLFILNFNSEKEENLLFGLPLFVYFGIFSLLIVIIILLFLLKSRKRDRKENNKETKSPIQDLKEKQKEENIEKKIIIVESEKKDLLEEEQKENKESFEQIVEKYLTDNEKEVVKVIKDNQGISQYDILNFLPSLTKSNLSKIISKLHSKKFLNRIRVGKVNKIYLGEKLEE